MSILRLYFDTSAKQLVQSASSPDVFYLPTFNQEDAIELEIAALIRINKLVNPIYEQVDLNGWGLSVSVGSEATELATQSVWSYSNKNLLGTLSLNTVALNAAFGTATYIDKKFEIKLVSPSGNPYRGQFDVKVRKSVIVSGSLVPVAGDTALGTLEAERRYAKKEMAAGEGLILTSQDGLLRAFVYLDNTGVLRADPIS